MLERLSKRREDEGFTLIELLVVIIIIGILAAIAIPVFLNQRKNAGDAALESDARNAAVAAQSCVTANQGRAVKADCEDLAVIGFTASAGVAVSVVEAVTGEVSATAVPGGADPVQANLTSVVYDTATGSLTKT